MFIGKDYKERRKLMKGAFGGSLTTLIITIAAVALAAFVVTVLWPSTPVTLTVDTQSSYLMVKGSDVVLYLRVTVKGDDIRILKITLIDDNGNDVVADLNSAEITPTASKGADFIQLQKDNSYTIKITISGGAANFYQKSLYQVVIDTDKAGTKIVKIPKV